MYIYLYHENVTNYYTEMNQLLQLCLNISLTAPIHIYVSTYANLVSTSENPDFETPDTKNKMVTYYNRAESPQCLHQHHM